MTVVAHRQDTAVRYRIYGHILSCNARLHELELTLPPDSTKNTDLRVQFLSSDESIPLPSSWYHTVSLADGTPWLRYAEISAGYLLHFPHLTDFVFDTSNNSILCLPQAKPPPTHLAPSAVGSGPSPCAQLQRERSLAWGCGRHTLWRLCIRRSNRRRKIYLGGKLSVCGIFRVNR